jgi:hypothetical protein
MKPSDTELVVGGIAAIVLIGLGVVLIAEGAAEPAGEGTDTSDLEDTSALASVATVL